MPTVKTYTRVNFQNYPSTSTPLNATNLNKLDKGIDDLDDEVVTVKNAIENMSFDADSISYDNTSSGLQATDVQDAVDEINDNLAQTPITVEGQTLSTIDDKLNFIVQKEANPNYEYLYSFVYVYSNGGIVETSNLNGGGYNYVISGNDAGSDSLLAWKMYDSGASYIKSLVRAKVKYYLINQDGVVYADEKTVDADEYIYNSNNKNFRGYVKIVAL